MRAFPDPSSSFDCVPKETKGDSRELREHVIAVTWLLESVRAMAVYVVAVTWLLESVRAIKC